MSVYELLPHSALHSGDARPYHPSRLQDDRDADAGGVASSLTSSLEPGNRKLFVRREQLALLPEGGPKIKPNVQIRRRHGALVS